MSLVHFEPVVSDLGSFLTVQRTDICNPQSGGYFEQVIDAEIAMLFAQ